MYETTIKIFLLLFYVIGLGYLIRELKKFFIALIDWILWHGENEKEVYWNRAEEITNLK